MSKKKNTLKDLNEFLKQQAATLVSPQQLSDKIGAPKEIKEELHEVAEPEEMLPVQKTEQPISAEKVFTDLQQLAKKEGHRFRHQFYDLIIRSIESQNQFSPEDKMLINTALYLKSGDQWKDTIREYWRQKNNG
jgi:hypothetical protein